MHVACPLKGRTLDVPVIAVGHFVKFVYEIFFDVQRMLLAGERTQLFQDSNTIAVRKELSRKLGREADLESIVGEDGSLALPLSAAPSSS